jgi:hypothetical protein
MIKHRKCNKQVRERVCDEPRLVSSVREIIRTVLRGLYHFEDLEAYSLDKYPGKIRLL